MNHHEKPADPIGPDLDIEAIEPGCDPDGSCRVCAGCAGHEDLTRVPMGKVPQEGEETVLLVGVRLHGRGKVYHFSPGDLTIRRGAHVIVETSQGIEMGVVADRPQYLPKSAVKVPLKKILRPASNDDLMHYEENKLLEKEALVKARERVEAHGLDMSLVSVEYRFDNRKITSFSPRTARRFRELVRDRPPFSGPGLSCARIGVRDEGLHGRGLGFVGASFAATPSSTNSGRSPSGWPRTRTCL